ncbi:MAG TPA: diphosphomevalonate decarboxylase [Motiliproteus sp.]
MRKQELLARLLPAARQPVSDQVEAFAPSNIALCKYWGKRNAELNLPINSSLSVSLADLGSRTRLTCIDAAADEVWLNNQPVAADTSFASKLIAYLDLFRIASTPRLKVETWNTIPTAAGLASSASGFAALAKAVDQLLGLNATEAQLSAFARLGSGSASRSIFSGFVAWEMGVREDGMDSIAHPLAARWPALRIGLLTVAEAAKPVGSRAGMQRTTETAHLYQSWPLQAAIDIEKIRSAIDNHDFELLGHTAEQNALSMHATMIASWPPLLYWQPASVAAMQQIWALREQGLPLYFTMDAGPNIKLLFEVEHQAAVESAFPGVQIVTPFSTP